MVDMTSRTRVGVATVSVIAVSALLIAWSWGRPGHGQYSNSDLAQAADESALQQSADLRVFFAHQSVGGNIVGGVPAAYAHAGIPAPDVIEVTGTPHEVSSLPSSSDGFFAHTTVGVNGAPIGKVQEFDAWMRSGMADQVDVAFLKLCYIDFTADTDVDAVFERYRETLGALERDYPKVEFVVLTTPLTTEPGMKTKVKALLGGNNPSPRDNAARQRYNALLRAEYGTEVFDVAAFESTAPDGTRIRGAVDDQEYFALYDGYALDEGHLNQTTSAVAAAQLMDFLADATR